MILLTHYLFLAFCKASPMFGSPSPKSGEAEPKSRSPSPMFGFASPKSGEAEPKSRSPSPMFGFASPKSGEAEPKSRSPSPDFRSPSPGFGSASPNPGEGEPNLRKPLLLKRQSILIVNEREYVLSSSGTGKRLFFSPAGFLFWKQQTPNAYICAAIFHPYEEYAFYAQAPCTRRQDGRICRL